MYGLIRASGADARGFLQGQLTNDLNLLSRDQPLLAAWCNAKGRVQAIFHVFERGDGIYLRLPGALIPLTLPRLKMFVLRAKVVLEDCSDRSPHLDLPSPPSALASIHAGEPVILPETRELFTPQMLNLDLLGGISFKKGCYPGQEVVAKTQYRGLVKRRLLAFSTQADDETRPGASLWNPDHATGEAAGEVVNAVRDERGRTCLLAVVKLDALGANPLRLDRRDGPVLVREVLPYPIPD